jgi:hypothetical protein
VDKPTEQLLVLLMQPFEAELSIVRGGVFVAAWTLGTVENAPNMAVRIRMSDKDRIMPILA